MKKYWLVLSFATVAVAIGVYKYRSADRLIDGGTVVMQEQPASASVPAPQAPARNPINAEVPFKDTSMLKPPAGAKVAVYEFEDLECPGCRAAAPIVHAAVAHYNIPLVRRDYPWSFHIWSFDAAVTARYLQDKVSPQLADEFRRDVFAGQPLIASKDDLTRFTAKWFQAHGQSLPFVMDANGTCKLEVESDRALGDQLGVRSTPCIFVVTQSKAIPVADVSQLGRMIEAALAQTAASSGMPRDNAPLVDMLRVAAARS
jgi:protein-disulfide isomerase